MSTATARACANIALVKYWGKRDAQLNLPAAGSLSLTLAALVTETTVSFDPALAADELVLDGTAARTKETARITMPVWSVPGNHELFGIERHLSLVSAKHPLYGRGMYRHYLGPDYYSFNAGGVHFVGLNTADNDDLWYYGHVDSTQLR